MIIPLYKKIELAKLYTQRVANLKDYKIPGKLNKYLRELARVNVKFNGGYYIELKNDPGVYCYFYDRVSRKIRFIKI